MTDTKNTIKKNGYVFLSALLVGVLINSQALFFSTDATDWIWSWSVWGFISPSALSTC